jgi:hypothetical protein
MMGSALSTLPKKTSPFRENLRIISGKEYTKVPFASGCKCGKMASWEQVAIVRAMKTASFRMKPTLIRA